MAKLIHSMVRVLEEKRSVEFYKQAFGLEIAERAEFENFTLIYLSNAEGDFELEPHCQPGSRSALCAG